MIHWKLLTKVAPVFAVAMLDHDTIAFDAYS